MILDRAITVSLYEGEASIPQPQIIEERQPNDLNECQENPKRNPDKVINNFIKISKPKQASIVIANLLANGYILGSEAVEKAAELDRKKFLLRIS